MRAFAIQEAVTADARATVYRAARASDGRTVLLKVLDTRPPAPGELEHLRNELEMAQRLDRSKVLRPLALETYEGMPALVREDFGGVPLEKILRGPLEARPFLDLAIAIAAALEHVHQAGLVHKDLTPRSILVRPGTNEVRLSEFGFTSRAEGSPQKVVQRPDRIEGTLPYMSPEQTGRTNRVVDSRSDLYSLGVVFFLMLTGELPFSASDPLGWIHAHVALPPPSPSTVSKAVPPCLSALVLRLLAKMPEERYQSAHGLRLDLERARAALPSHPEVFPLGEHDVSERLKISQRLYGREAELAQLRRVLKETLETGRPALVLVSGYSGIGKSSLVDELLGSVEDARGMFLSGKFDIQQRSVPYSAIIQAFRRALRDLLGGSEVRLASWRSLLGLALGHSGRLIAEVIPEAELILGPQAPVAPLQPLEAERRFLRVLHAFVAAFGRAENPLILFLDDLQWADIASLKLIEQLLTDEDTHHVLLIGAARDNEVDAAHPLSLSLERLKQAGVRVEEIVLHPLRLDHVVALCMDTVRRSALEVRPLAELVHEKTGGNPFFINQFFNELLRDGLLTFDTREWRWRWDLERIREHDYTENVAEFMVQRMARLPEGTRELVRLAACFGNAIDPKTLSVIAGVEEPELERALQPAREENLLLLGQRSYRFAHDRVQQAAYSLVPEAERPAVHLRVGRLLLRATPVGELNEKLFAIVNQQNHGIALITDPKERMALARLNLAAEQKARDTAAPVAALEYLDAAIELLGGVNGWRVGYDVLYPAHLVGAECAFLLGDMRRALGLLDAIERHGRHLLDRVSGRNVRAWFLIHQGRSVEATEYTMDTARLLGMELPSPEDTAAIQREIAEAFAAYQATLAGRSVESLAELPPLESLVELALFDTLQKAILATFHWNTELMILLTLKAVLLAGAEHRAPSFFYVHYGIVHSCLTEDYTTAFRFGELAVRLADYLETTGVTAASVGGRPSAGGIHLLHAISICHLKRHISECLKHLEIAFRASTEDGDPVLSDYTLAMRLSYRLYAGEPLDAIRHDLDDAQQIIQRAGDVVNDGLVTATRQTIRALKGQTASLTRLDDAEFKEQEFEAAPLPLVLPHYYANQMMVRYMGGDFEGVLRAAESFKPLPGLFFNVWHRFYRGLALARRAEVAAPAERSSAIERLSAEARFMAILARHSPANHGHHEKLLRGELARLEGDVPTAMHFFEEAAQEAEENGFLHEEALAYELASHTLRAAGFALGADLYLDEARRAYRIWGAEGKVQQLERHFARPARRRASSEQAFVSSQQALDSIAVLKAGQAISGELSWKRVSERLLDVAIEESGATYGCLMFTRDGELLVGAVARAEQRAVSTNLIDLVPLESMPVAPKSIAKWVARSGELMMVDEPSAPGSYSNDPYIRERRPRSLLCLPLLGPREVFAVLYLENQLVSGVFTRPRVTVLQLIAGQAAIALANADLFGKLQQENADRRRAEEFLTESRGLLQQIIDNSGALIVVKSRDGSYLLTNRSFDELHHLSHEDVLSAGDAALAGHESAEKRRSNDRLVLEANRPLEFEETLDLPDGERTFLTIRFPLRDATGRPYAVCAIGTDITARKRFEDQLRESIAREREARSAAEEAVRVRDEFLSIASHELRTPLTSLQLASHGLTRRLSKECAAPVQHNLEVFERQIRRLGHLVSSLLDVPRIQAGRLVLERRVVNLGTLVRDTVEQLALDLRRSRSTLTLRVAAEPILGCWDAPRIEQIVINLLSNAFKFGEGRPIEVSVEARDGKACLTVTDHGIGIPEDMQKLVFDRFGRAVSARHYGGLGLGLYIVRTIAQAHGGDVFLKSAVGQGSSFTVELPLSVPDSAAKQH